MHIKDQSFKEVVKTRFAKCSAEDARVLLFCWRHGNEFGVFDPSGYTEEELRVRLDKDGLQDLSDIEVRVYVALVAHADEKGEAVVRLSRLAKWVLRGYRAGPIPFPLTEAITTLDDLGKISIHECASNRLRVTIPEFIRETTTPEDDWYGLE